MRNLQKLLLSAVLSLSLFGQAFAQGVGGVTGGGGAAVTAAQGTAAGSGPWIFTPWIGGAVNSATNGLYFNPLQGNVALSATNGIFTNILQGNAVLSITNPLFANTVSTGVTSAQAAGFTPTVSTVNTDSGKVFNAAATNMYGVYATNETTTSGYLMCFNSTTVPADGAVTPLDCVPLSGSGVTAINYSPGPPGNYSTGLSCAVSSGADCFTKTTGVIKAFFHGTFK